METNEQTKLIRKIKRAYVNVADLIYKEDFPQETLDAFKKELDSQFSRLKLCMECTEWEIIEECFPGQTEHLLKNVGRVIASKYFPFSKIKDAEEYDSYDSFYKEYIELTIVSIEILKGMSGTIPEILKTYREQTNFTGTITLEQFITDIDPATGEPASSLYSQCVKETDHQVFDTAYQAAQDILSANKKPNTKKTSLDNDIEANLLAERARAKEFFNVPTSPATDTVLKVLGAGKKLESQEGAEAFIERNQAISHSKKYKVKFDEKKRFIKVDGNSSNVTLEVTDIENLIGNNKPAKKLFVFASIKIAEQALNNGELRRDYIEFPLQALIDTGNYKSLDSARRGFKSAMRVLSSIKIEGTFKEGKNTIVQESGRTPFPDWDIKQNTCYIYISPRINWNFVFQFYTILPKYCFALPNRAFDLLVYIFYLARQNTNAIKARGYFTISMRAVQMRLGLPSEKENTNPDRTIREPIEKAIEEIENLNNNANFTITPIYDSDKPILDFLDRGYLEIRLQKEFAEYFIKLSQKQEKKIETYKKRQEAIVDRAKEKALVNKLESEN